MSRELQYLTRLCALTALHVAHVDLHPEAYQDPCGQRLREQVTEECQALFREPFPSPELALAMAETLATRLSAVCRILQERRVASSE